MFSSWISHCFVSWRASYLISGSQINVQRNTKKRHVTFVKRHASNSRKIRSRRTVEVKGLILCLLRHRPFIQYFDTWLKSYIHTYFILVVNQLVVFPFPQSRHYLLVYFGGNYKGRRFCYPVLLPSCNIYSSVEVDLVPSQTVGVF